MRRLRRAKQLLSACICHAFVGRALSMVLRDRIRYRGQVIDTSYEGIAPEVKAKLFWGIYESAEARFVQRHLRRDLDVVELGGSLGALTTLIAARTTPARRVICVEANPALLQQIRTNVDGNHPDARLEIVNGAVHRRDDRTGSVAFQISDNVTSSQVAVAGSPNCIEVPAITLSEVLRTYEVGAYALVSDIEGSEASFINDDPECLARCEQLIIELHDTVWDGRRFAVADMRDRLVGLHGFFLRDQHGPVFVFDRVAS